MGRVCEPGDLMTVLTLDTIAAASTAADDSGPGSFIFIAVAIALAGAVTTLIFRRRSQASKDAATGGVADVFAFIIAPAPPLADRVAELRTLVGETTAPPRMTRYTRPVVVGNYVALTISDKKAGALVTIPASYVVSIEARPVALKPHGTLIATSYPAVWVTVRRDATEVSVALAPIVAPYDKVSPAEAQALATELAIRLGLLTR